MSPMPARQDGSTARNEERQRPLFKEQLQIASNQPSGLTRSSSRVRWPHFFLWNTLKMSQSVEKPDIVIRVLSDSGGWQDLGCWIGKWWWKQPFISCLDTQEPRLLKLAVKESLWKPRRFDVTGSNRGSSQISRSRIQINFEKCSKAEPISAHSLSNKNIIFCEAKGSCCAQRSADV